MTKKKNVREFNFHFQYRTIQSTDTSIHETFDHKDYVRNISFRLKT